MICRAGLAVILAVVVLLAGASPAASDPPRSVPSYYLGAADLRRCAPPVCGGLWLTLVNRSSTLCGDGTERRQCYAASADLSGLDVSPKRRARLAQLIRAGRALARGTLVQGRVRGFPLLDTFVVSEVWVASSSQSEPRGSFRRLAETGIRCFTTPCFSIRASELNTRRSTTVSEVRLGPTGAPARERERALALVAAGRLIAAGRIGRVPDAGPAGDGRAFGATQFYLRAGTRG
jgi:hypothetical protein